MTDDVAAVVHCKECGNYKAFGENCPVDKPNCPHLGDETVFAGQTADNVQTFSSEQDGHISNYVDTDDIPTVAISTAAEQTTELISQDKNIETLDIGRTNTMNENLIDDPVTEIYSNEKLKASDPVVGWLVCIEGPSFGTDYKLVMQQNSIGRHPAQVAIKDDVQISHGSHAIITYDNEDNTFILRPGDQRGITRLNGKRLDLPTELKSHDKIKLGQSTLLFVPCCTEMFQWPDLDNADGDNS